MNREKAAEMLKRLNYDYQNGADENDCFYEMYLYALDTAITILTSPLVKTSDRLPTESPVNETSIVMKTRHTFRGPDYERPYCGACNHYVPDANAAFCCWCGAKFVTACVSMSADEAEVEK